MARIIAHCNAYNARTHYHGEEVVERDGNTPVAWVVGTYATDEEARTALWKMALAEEEKHFGELSHEDDESAAELDDSGEWYEGEGIYFRDGHDIMMLKGDSLYSYDVMTYSID